MLLHGSGRSGKMHWQKLLKLVWLFESAVPAGAETAAMAAMAGAPLTRSNDNSSSSGSNRSSRSSSGSVIGRKQQRQQQGRVWVWLI